MTLRTTTFMCHPGLSFNFRFSRVFFCVARNVSSCVEVFNQMVCGHQALEPLPVFHSNAHTQNWQESLMHRVCCIMITENVRIRYVDFEKFQS